jgi:PPK2 family polyphosphate:nucleotide phosphotransferase
MKRLDHDTHLAPVPGKIVSVTDFETDYSGEIKDKDDANAELSDNIEWISTLQAKLYAHNRYSVLIIFQAMDAAGKDGTIKHVMSGLNPQGTQVYSFKTPSPEELDHDYLWRTYRCMPERGRIGIFNRSYYEEVLVVRVHPEYLLNQQLPQVTSLPHVSPSFWEDRYRQINNMEQHLAENGTLILKFFLNVSKDEQKKRFLKRIDDPSANWKFSMADVSERQHWDEYMQAYSEMLSHTNTPHAPWYVIPADKKWFMRMAVSNIIANKLNDLNLSYPVLDPKEMAKLEEARYRLMNE